MGFKTASTRRSTATSAVSSQAVVINSGNTAPSGTSSYTIAGAVSANTTITIGVTTPGQSSANSAVTAASGPIITTLQYLDANNAVITGANAVSTTGGNILVNGSNFVTNSSVYINNTLVTNTFISSSQIRAICPAASAGNVSLMIFSPTNVGTLQANIVKYSGVPSWTTAAVSFQNGAAANVALVASSDSTLTYTLQAGSTLPTGISLQSAGYLAGTATGYGSNTTSSAVLIATDLEGQAAQQTINWTVSVADPQFNYTTLLLNGETSVTPFIADASTNNYPIGLAGDTRADKFSPYQGDGYYSNLFDGSSGWLSITSQAALAFGTGDFTLECWVYLNSATIPASAGVYDQRNGTNGAGVTQPVLELTSGTGYGWYVNAANKITSTTTPVKFYQWQHIAVSRVSGSTRMYIDGVQVGSTYTDGNNYPAGSITIGRENDGVNTRYFPGNIYGMRSVVGTGLYSGTTLTVPTSPLTAIANTKLLTCQSNNFVDKSTNAFTITQNGTVKVSSAIPFSASATYANYGSAYFDGTGDWLTFASTYVPTGSGTALTLEFWIYPTRNFASAVMGIISSGNMEINIDTTNTGQVRFDLPAGVTNVANTGANAVNTFSWNHIALTRTAGNSYTLYLNGVTTGAGLTSATGITALTTFGYKATNPFQGYVADLRSVSALVYSSAFTPPATPLTAVANTNLLTAQYNGGANNYGIIDNGPFNNVITRAGNATQGTFSPYSATGWSNYLDGTGNFQTSAGSTTTIFGGSGLLTSSSVVTIEGWMYETSRDGSPDTRSMFGDFAPSSASNNWGLGTNASGYLCFNYYNGSVQTATSSTTVIPLNTWTHFAVVISATSLKLFVNGVLQTISGTTTMTGASSTVGYLAAGGWNSNTTNNRYLGYLSNIRVLSGTALYSTTFTPPTSPLTAITNTKLLVCQSNRFTDNGGSNFTITLRNTPSIQAFSPFAPSAAYTPTLHGGSAYFDGTGDYLTNTSSPAVANFGTSDFTWEAWLYFASTNTTSEWDIFEAQPTSGAFQVYRSTANSLLYGAYGGTGNNVTPVNAIPIYQWFHLALSRTSGTVSCYINGTRQTTVADTTNYNQTGISVGGRNSGANYLPGYISDMRIIKGTGIYSGTTISVPTTPLAPTTSTTLLLNFTNGGIVDAHSSNVLETVGNAQLSTAVKKYGNASMYFDGTGDWLTVIDTANLQMRAGDFTVEGWVYITTLGSARGLVSKGTATTGWTIGVNSSNQLAAGYTTTTLAGTTALTANTWYHFAMVRYGSASGNIKIYLNGTLEATSASAITTDFSGTDILYIGADRAAGSPMLGYLDDVRITKGFARYTANFTAPTTGFLGQ